MKHVKTLNTQTLNNTVKKGGCGEWPDILPVRMQDILYRRKSDLREQKVVRDSFVDKEYPETAVLRSAVSCRIKEKKERGIKLDSPV